MHSLNPKQAGFIVCKTLYSVICATFATFIFISVISFINDVLSSALNRNCVGQRGLIFVQSACFKCASWPLWSL